MIIKNYKRLIKKNGLRKKALQVLDAGLEAIKTRKIIKDKVKLKNNILFINNYKNKLKKYNLKKFKNIHIIGFGKASSLMGKEIEKVLKSRVAGGLIISTKRIKLKRIKVVKGMHPMPALKNVNAAKEIVKMIKGLDENDLVICLVSGGGSALLCYPNISLKNYLKVIKKHFASGIDITRLNKIRKSLSNVKGGKLAKLTKAKIVSLIFSDVVGDDLATIASGPTAGAKNADNILLLNNSVALEAMKDKAASLGLKPVVYSNKVKGEARLVWKKLLKYYKKLKNRKICLLFAGETTVNVKGSGKGGRCQELCLAAIEDVSKLRNTVLVSIGTDGMDGPTNAAGAIIDSDSLEKSKKLNLNYKKYLKNNDAYHFFKKTDELVMTGLTGSNVADIGLVMKL